MTAAIATNRRAYPTGLRPVDPRRDMLAMAELIELAFSENLDATGQNMVKNMRILGRLGWVGWLMGRLVLPPAANPKGFVWEEDGRVVGNASLLPVNRYPDRWVMANVAVRPEYRRQGIGKELVNASIELVRQYSGEIIILQADRDAPGVERMYANRGFQSLSTRTQWTRRTVRTNHNFQFADQVRLRAQVEWRDEWDMARRYHPEGIIWPFPPQIGLFQPTGWAQKTGRQRGWNWVWEQDGRKLAFLSAKWNFERGHWRLIMITEPEAYGMVEDGLLTACLAELQRVGGPCMLEYPADVAEEVLKVKGFAPARTLTWMGMRLTPHPTV